jgi:hypothetical protein
LAAHERNDGLMGAIYRSSANSMSYFIGRFE